ncbi:MAG: asparagine synthase (glutamine-hydrolyzing), partial [Vicinamibacteria bacterium]|nr:asparagine synthase (glutamine-hydrolyzing) [Vicinamibacteria bacterium]
MCGLAGILSFDGVPIDARQLAAMGASLAHRGPDAEGTHRDAQAAPSIGLIQRRLAVIDLSAAANQPLANEDQTIWALLNGEIYNFAELRERLAARHTLKTSGDTEVLVHLYEEEAETGLAQLDGMFALAIWDARRRRLLLARDPFGKKPLYYTTDGRRFLFASEIKALLAAEVPARLAVARVPEYLAYGYVPTPHTLFAGIYKLPPASFLTVDASGVSAAREYYALAVPAQGEESKDSFEQATERVRDLLTRAVQKRLIADVPLGILLSGGVDSSGLAALAARHLPGRLKTFTVGFEGDAFYDERAPAAAVARALGSEHHESVVRPQAGALIETLLHHHDEPFGDSSALPMYLVAQEARRHVTVVIGGDGGDETFAGYDRFRAAQLAEKMPLVLRRLFAGLRVLPEGSLHHGFLRRLRRFVDAAAQPLDRRMQAWTGFFTVDEVSARLGIQADPDALLTSYREA